MVQPRGADVLHPSRPGSGFLTRYSFVDKKSGKVDGAWELSDNLKSYVYATSNRNVI